MEDYIINTIDTDIDFTNVNKVCKLIVKKFKITNPVFNIIIIDNNRIHEINKQYRDIDRETDVISFAFEEVEDVKYESVRFLGEIYISYEKCVEQAKEYGHSVDRELCYLTVHGMLHLLGYDHMKEEDKVVMRALEEEILNEYDIKR